jgi:hypothetical protein
VSNPATATTSDDGNRFYTHPVTGDQLMSVTTVLSATLAKQHILTPWSARLTAEYAVDNLALITQTIAEEGRDAAVTLLKDQSRLLRERKRDAGSYVHDVQEALILWAASPDRLGADIALPTLPEHLEDALYDDEALEDVVDWMVTGFTAFVSDWDPVFEAAEMTVFNLLLKVAGTLDMIVRLSDVALTPEGRIVAAPGHVLTLCVDTKTGRFLDATVQEQLAAYRRMREALLPMGEVVPMPATDGAAVLHLRPEHADGYRLIPLAPSDDAHAWNRFRRAVELAEGRSQIGAKPGKVARPPRPDGTTPAPRLADLDGEGYGRALSALARTGCADLDEIASFTAADLLAVKGIGAKTVDTARRLLSDYGLHLSDETPQHEEKVA